MKRFIVFTLGCLLFIGCNLAPLQAQDVSDLMITGVVKNKDSRKKLENVNVSIAGTSIGTVTNADGIFSLKVKRTEALRGIEVSHIGYLNTRLSLEEIVNSSNGLIVWMMPAPNLLGEIVVYGNNPRAVVEEAIRRIAPNYADADNRLTAFYRETIQKRRRYISISEAVMDVYKTTYNDRTTNRDKVQLLKGRRLLSQKQSDTLAVKVQGGPNQSIYLDVVKNGDALLSLENIEYYDFRMDEPLNLDSRLQYVISFQPRVRLPYALFIGKLFIDFEHLFFTRAEFSLDLSDRVKAIEAILQKKPLGLRFRPQEVSYLVTYKQQGNKSYLNYIQNIMRFKCDWQKKLFSATYTAFSEMVITDRMPQSVNTIPYKSTFKQKQVFYDLVNGYWNEDFWQHYNIIEPTESLENAVDKLKKKE